MNILTLLKEIKYYHKNSWDKMLYCVARHVWYLTAFEDVQKTKILAIVASVLLP